MNSDILLLTRRKIGLLLFGLLLILLLCPAPALAEAELPQPRLYIEPLPLQAVASLPEPAEAGTDLHLRSGYQASCMWEADLPAGSTYYLIQPWAAGGLYHMVLAQGRTWYVSTAELDVSNGYVFNADQDMRTKSGYSAEQLESLLQGGLSGYGADFKAAEDAYGVNALLLIAICRLESGWADSYLAVNYHNLAGLGGAGNWLYFDSHSACIDYLGKILAERYLNPESSFCKGFTISAICRTYCGGSSHWTNSVIRYMSSFSEALQNEALLLAA